MPVVVVTGGAGFIGANLCRTLAQDGWEVVAFDDLSTGTADNLSPQDGVRLAVGSILDAEALRAVTADAESIVHLAARPSVPRSIADPMASNEVNVTGTLQVLEAARESRGKHVIVASSSSVYGANTTLPKHERLLPQPVSPYAVSKLATETYALAYAQCFDLSSLAFRFFNVYGPLQRAGHAYAAVIPAFVEAALASEPLPIHGDGLQTRDFTFVGSVAGVIAEAVRTKLSMASPVNLAFGARSSLLEVADELERILGRKLERDHLGSRAGDVRDSQADQARLREMFPSAEPVGLREGLEATVRWFTTGQLG